MRQRESFKDQQAALLERFNANISSYYRNEAIKMIEAFRYIQDPGTHTIEVIKTVR